ncbi:PIR Superfamily Protein [Plasmodium ovale wallikeri]|uniref:PIR Superfamily Protein n=1 Tax=Plasmodium ovale wallikeri TaxID=864142 RepID=A0A1A9ARS4_PLAOA|nr:PIR Superfamily Protein [Plasmodium ovale wallikeri]SBT58822.1 PIR Superfamily Protein [Plasmodium ovale wallikeri]
MGYFPNRYPFLKSLPLYTFYEKLENRHEKEIEDPSHCNEIAEVDDCAYPVCAKVVNTLDSLGNNITVLDKESDDGDDSNRACLYLNEWLDNNIRIYGCNHTKVDLIYDKLNEKMGKLKLKNNCNFEKSKYINNDLNYVSAKKKLYYFSENLYWIYKKKLGKQKEEKQLFEKYLRDCSATYNSQLKNDFCKTHRLYESELDDFKKQYTETSSFLQSCYPEIDITPLHHYDKSETKCVGEKIYNESEEKPEDMFRYIQTKKINTEDQDAKQMEGDAYNKFDILSKGVVPFIGFSFVIFIILFILYKFTPYGLWMRRRLSKKNMMSDNIDLLNTQSLMEHNPEYEELNSDAAHINIAYYNV